MKPKQKPLSFSLCAENIAYVEAQHSVKHRNKSHWMDDLLTHLRTKSESTNTAVVEKPKAPVKRFVPPTLIEVTDYMFEKTGNHHFDEPVKFCDFYQSNGWKVGRNKMKSWKAAVRNWLKNYKQKSGGKDILASSSASNWHLEEDRGF